MTLLFNRRQAAAAVAATLSWRSAPAAESFDAWCDAFAADWVRLSAEGATFSQFFSGAEHGRRSGLAPVEVQAHVDRAFAASWMAARMRG